MRWKSSAAGSRSGVAAAQEPAQGAKGDAVAREALLLPELEEVEQQRMGGGPTPAEPRSVGRPLAHHGLAVPPQDLVGVVETIGAGPEVPLAKAEGRKLGQVAVVTRVPGNGVRADRRWLRAAPSCGLSRGLLGSPLAEVSQDPAR